MVNSVLSAKKAGVCRVDSVDMGSIIVEPYTADRADEWTEFVSSSPNGTFLFCRDYMDYHADRFADCSLLFREQSANRSKLVSVLPASKHGDTVVSHGGLTYGGFVQPAQGIGGARMLRVVDAAVDHYRSLGFRHLRYKAIPWIYQCVPSDEDIYAMFRHSARLVECNLSSALYTHSYDIKKDDNTLRNERRAAVAGLGFDRDVPVGEFWPLLEGVLEDRHGAAPVHSCQEMMMLKSRFPKNIFIHGARGCDGSLLAGTVVYLTSRVAHTQYIASGCEGRRTGALAFLMDRVKELYSHEVPVLDFGTSNEHHGQVLNEGLLRNKFGMGGRGVAYCIYEIDL